MPFTETLVKDNGLFMLFADYLTYLLHLEKVHNSFANADDKARQIEKLSRSLERADRALIHAVNDRYEISRVQWIHHAAQVILDRHPEGKQFFLDRLPQPGPQK